MRFSAPQATLVAKFLFAGSLAICGTLLAAQAGPDDGGKSLGIVATKDANTKDVGLPMYPGAKLASKDEHGEPTAQLGLWFGGTGMKLVLVKLESDDSSEKIASFYKGALGRYGKVLDCSGNKSGESHRQDSNSKELTCEDEHEDNGIVLKSGTKENQHIVGIQAKGGKRIIQLVYLLTRSDDDKKI